MKRSSLVLITSFLLVISPKEISLRAQEATATASPSTNATVLADELVTLLHLDRNIDSMRANINRMTTAMTGDALKNVPPEIRKETDKKSNQMLDTIFSSMSWEKMKPMYVTVYAETFTPEELQAMIAFYRTEAGQKWIEKQPQLQAAMMQKSMGMMTEIQGKIMESIKNRTPAPATNP
jgi:hypothetical protein